MQDMLVEKNKQCIVCKRTMVKKTIIPICPYCKDRTLSKIGKIAGTVITVGYTVLEILNKVNNDKDDK